MNDKDMKIAFVLGGGGAIATFLSYLVWLV